MKTSDQELARRLAAANKAALALSKAMALVEAKREAYAKAHARVLEITKGEL